MQIGVHLPQIGPLATREGIASFARRAEGLGFDSVWVSDHIVVPRHIGSAYPGTPDGRFPVPPDLPFLEALSTLLFVAGCTERVRLGTSVCVVPWRHPVVTAKVLATLDVLSGGRLIFGAGAGWMEEQFRIMGRPFAERGTLTDEWLTAAKALWTEENPRFRGRFFAFEEIGFAPKPLQKPHPPIWIGGDSEAARRRAGRLGDAWHASGFTPVAELAAALAGVRRFAREAGRDPESVGLTARTGVSLADGPGPAIDHLRDYERAGVSHLVLEVRAPSLEQLRETLERLASEVRPPLASPVP